MTNATIDVAILLGIVLLSGALIPIKNTCKVLPSGLTRFVWICVAGLISLSILGYILFLRLDGGAGPRHNEDALSAIIFLAAAIIVFIACTISSYSARDVASIAALEHAARIDSLTDLYNRRHIMTLLERECARSRRFKTTVSILLLDIDRFKAINDTFGHPTGDHVLRWISCAIVQSHKDCKLIGRYGGEEFLIVLPNTSSDEATRYAERIRATVEAATISFENDPFIPVTISIGVAASQFNDTPNQLIALADRALYAAKAGGRNQVCTSANSSISPCHLQPTSAFPVVPSSRVSIGSIKELDCS